MNDAIVRTSSKAWQRYDSCCLGISLGNVYFDGPYLGSVVAWLKQTNFKTFHILLADKLNRFNLMKTDGVSEQEASEICHALGTEWIDRNRKTLLDLGTGLMIHRWDDLFYYDESQEYVTAFKKLLETNLDYKDALFRDVTVFLERRTEVPTAKNFFASVDYITEEIALHSLFFKYNPGVKFYTGKDMECFHLVWQGKIPGAPAGLEQRKYVRLWIDTNKVTQQKPIAA